MWKKVKKSQFIDDTFTFATLKLPRLSTFNKTSFLPISFETQTSNWKLPMHVGCLQEAQHAQCN